MSHAKPLLLTCLVSCLGACAADAKDPPPIEDRAAASEAFDVVVGRLGGLDPKADALHREEGDVLRAFEVAIDVDGELDCLEGGSFSFDGEAEGSAELGAQMASFDVDVQFDGCRIDDVVVDGGLSHTAVVANDGGDVMVDYHYAGLLIFNGEVEGSCAFDFGAHVERVPGSVTATTSYSGDFCGFDVADLDVSVQIDIDG